MRQPDFLSLPPVRVGITPAAVVLPVPWERSTSYGRGTREAPAAICEASEQVELYDEELDADTWRAGISTGPALEPLGDDPEEALAAIEAAVEQALGDGSLPVLLGGEHTLTVGAVRAVARHYSELTVLQIDAHADLRDSYEGDRWSHACTMARVREICPHVGIGIRALARSEAELIRSSRLPIWLASECRGTDWVEAAVEKLSEQVYVSVDLDGLDPSVIPAVGTPEPGGLTWAQTLALLRLCAARRQIVGVDVVELCPRPAERRSAFAAARLTYRLIGYALTAGGTRDCPIRLE